MIALRALDPPADRPLLERLWDAALGPVWPLAPVALDIARHGLVAEEEDGAGLGVVVIDPAGSIPLLLVDPAHQRRGVGTRLLDGAMERLGELGRPRWGWGVAGTTTSGPGCRTTCRPRPASPSTCWPSATAPRRSPSRRPPSPTGWCVRAAGRLGAGRLRRGRSRLRPRHGAGGRRPGRSCGRPGSPTSVPGLAAKAIIDILLVVPDPSDEPSYVPDLQAAGYVLVIREPDWYQHRCCKGPDTNVNLHVYPPGCPEIEAAP